MILTSLMNLLGCFYFFFLRITSGGSLPEVLSREKEDEYIEKCEAGDGEARRVLIEHNLRLVAHIVKKYYSSCDESEDLMSVGTIGLIKAIDTFRRDRGAKFATYAGKCVQNEILMYMRSKKKTACETSINDSVETDRDGEPITYLDVIAVDDDMVEKLDVKMKSRAAFEAFESVLTPREKKIIMMRYGLNGKKPLAQRETAELLGISRSYVSRIEKGALGKMREHMTRFTAPQCGEQGGEKEEKT